MGSRPRPSPWLLAAGIGLFQVVGSFGAADNQPDRNAMDLVAVLLVLAGPATLGLRDRHPLLAAAVAIGAADLYVALGYPYGPIFVSVAVALFFAVQAADRRQVWALAAAGYVTFGVAHVADPRSGPFNGTHLALVAGWLTVVLAVSEVVRIKRVQGAERERAEYDRGLRQIGEQRLRIAQELHDVLAHNISLINVQASVALHLVEDEPDRAGPALASIKAASHEALQELRTALDMLRGADDAARAPAPRLADLAALVDGVRAGGLDVRIEDAGAPAPLPAALELAAYRIIQEALTNVTRHADARHVTVRVTYDDGITVEVTDDGRGGEAVPHNGLRGMQERAAALGGTVEAGPRPGGGFRVLARLGPS